ncbi:MAG TPA: carbohydrate kinase [Chthoniobacteraceae bacterium]|jgi:fructokinase
MSAEYYTFGEILWDFLPTGKHAGGAPFNVAVHLAQLGCPASLISAVGHDPLGDEILALAAGKAVETHFISRAADTLPTGTVTVALDARGNASYKFLQPAAWDEISAGEEVVAAVGGARALVFGSLALRSAHNLQRLQPLLETSGPMKFFDINLRPPFVNLPLVLELAGKVDVLKLNEEELGLLVAWIQNSDTDASRLLSLPEVAEACATVARASAVPRICVTRGSHGAAFWQAGRLVSTAAPEVQVSDTVGAGDAFMAALVAGLTQQKEPLEALERACRVGAFVASQSGATPWLPPDLIREFCV